MNPFIDFDISIDLDELCIKITRDKVDITASRVDEVNTPAECPAFLNRYKACCHAARDVMKQGKTRR